MKTRNGFVSNSSSSSFIVSIPNGCSTFDEFLKTGLARYEWNHELHEDYQPNLDLPVTNWKTHSEIVKTNRECIRQLWDDIGLKGSKIELNEMIDLLDGFVPETTLYGYPFIDTYCVPGNIANIYSDLYGREKSEVIRKKLEKIGDEWNSVVGGALIRDLSDFCNMYTILYSDNEGEGLMEHGSFWEYIYHIKINQH